MISTYLKSKNKVSLEILQEAMKYVIGVNQGSAASSAIGLDGERLPDIPAKGDPDYFYVCIFAPFPIAPYGDIEACDELEGTSVCGVWA